jgi:serine protease AprX
VITVGSARTFGTPPRSDDTVSTFSSRGPTFLDGLSKPDLLAPGSRIISVRAVGSYLDTSYPENRLPRSAYQPGATGSSPYFILSGTSMATPVVAAAASIVIERNPNLTPNTIKAVLMYSAQTVSLGLSTGLSDLTQGAGYLNIPGALEIAARINASAPTGAYWLNANLSGSSVIQGETILWGRAIFWANRRATGDTISYNQFAWGGNIAWGESGSWSSNIAWGENAVTSDPSWQSAATWSNAQIWTAGAPTTSTLIRGD